VPLDARKVAHVAANRARMAAGRSETVTVVSVSAGAVVAQAVTGCVWLDTGAVPAGVTNRIGEIIRTGHDAVLQVPGSVVWPDDVRYVARCSGGTLAAAQSARRYVVLDKRKVGMGTTGSGAASATDDSWHGDRWVCRLRLLR
jgi:hypothetical protein